MSCPLTAAYLRGVRKNLSEKDKILYEDLFESLDELEEQCKDSTSSDTSQRLRAFFCIETMKDALPKALALGLDEKSSAEYEDFIKKFEGPQFKRSWAGLSSLINAIDQFEREIVLEGEEIRATLPTRDSSNVASMVADLLNISEGRLNHLRRAASILRRDLRDPINEVHRIGSIMAEFMRKLATPSNQLSVGRQLLQINIHTEKP